MTNESRLKPILFGYCEIHKTHYPTVFCNQYGAELACIEGCPICKKEKRLKSIFGYSAIPLRFAHASFDNYEVSNGGQKLALDRCKEFCQSLIDDNKGQSLIFMGAPGTGKTHLACAIAHEFMTKTYKSALFTDVPKLIREVRSTWQKDAQFSEKQVLKNLVEVDLLIIDEVGVQYGTDSERNILFEVINGRYENMKPMILISNFAKDDLESFLGVRVFDRLREISKGVVFNWESYRK